MERYSAIIGTSTRWRVYHGTFPSMIILQPNKGNGTGVACWSFADGTVVRGRWHAAVCVNVTEDMPFAAVYALGIELERPYDHAGLTSR